MKIEELLEYDYAVDKKKPGSRRTDDPDITGYEEVPVKKTDPTNIGQVIVYLKGKRSAHFTKLARRFERAARIKKMLAAEEAQLKAQTREAVDDIFNAGDEVYTRVVDTASLVFKIAKAEERTTTSFDEKSYLLELERLTGLAVSELEKIKQKYITTAVAKIDSKVLAPKEKKGITEGVFDSIKTYASRVKDYIMRFLSNWDEQFAEVKAQVEADLI